MINYRGLPLWLRLRFWFIDPFVLFFGPLKYGFKSVYNTKTGERLGFLCAIIMMGTGENYVYYTGTEYTVFGSHLTHIA